MSWKQTKAVICDNGIIGKGLALQGMAYLAMMKLHFMSGFDLIKVSEQSP